MKALTELELDEIEGFSNPETAIHVFVFNKYKEYGYERTQNWIRRTLMEWKWEKYTIVKNYLNNCVKNNEQFEPYKDELLKITLELSYDKLTPWVHGMNKKGFNKNSIYKILNELFVYIQFNPLTENNDYYYDYIADFLDGFTAWGKSSRILPNEPDCE